MKRILTVLCLLSVLIIPTTTVKGDALFVTNNTTSIERIGGNIILSLDATILNTTSCEATIIFPCVPLDKNDRPISEMSTITVSKLKPGEQRDYRIRFCYDIKTLESLGAASLVCNPEYRLRGGCENKETPADHLDFVFTRDEIDLIE